jgi:hypothetical protein
MLNIAGKNFTQTALRESGVDEKRWNHAFQSGQTLGAV